MPAPFIMRNDNDSPEAVSMKRLETRTQPAAESQQRSKGLNNIQTVSAGVEHGKEHRQVPGTLSGASARNKNPSRRFQHHADTFESLPEDEPRMLLQPDTRPISHEQLVVEVKGIYAGLVTVQAKCIGIDERQSAAAQVREYSSLFPKILRRQRLYANFSPLVPLFPFFLPAVSGSPIGLNQADASSSIALLLPLVTGSLYLGFAAATLAVAHSLTAKKSPIRVWVSMMSISAYGWWALRNDVIASPSLSLAVLGVWAASAFQYGNATFQEFGVPERTLLITLFAAVILDMAILSFMTPSGVPISQSDLLTLSLPAMSLSLAITANIFGYFRNQPPSLLPSHEMQAGVSISRHDPYYEDLFQQRRTIPNSGTSRPLLLGSPLDEDSTRIWDTDDS